MINPEEDYYAFADNVPPALLLGIHVHLTNEKLDNEAQLSTHQHRLCRMIGREVLLQPVLPALRFKIMPHRMIRKAQDRIKDNTLPFTLD